MDVPTRKEYIWNPYALDEVVKHPVGA